MLTPGQLSPLDLKSVYSVRPGSVVMIFPRSRDHVTIDIAQLDVNFTLSVDPSMTVYSLKKHIRKMRGIPIDRQELLYMDQALENNRRLLEYKVKNRSILYVMIQAHFDLLINVDTFWGITYRFYVDPCSTGTDVVHNVFSRTFSPSGPREYNGVHEFFIPLHTLVLSHKSRFVLWDYCLAGMAIKSGDRLSLTTVGHQNHMKSQAISVVTDNGQRYEVKASRYDRWSVVAFLMHGLTNVPVDFIKLYKDKELLNFMRMIGEVPKGTAIVMNVVMTHVDGDLMFGVPLRVSLGNGIIENVKISANKTVRSIKKKLEHFGVPNASQYQLLIGNKKLPNSNIIQNVVYDLKTPLALKLEEFAVFVHTPDGVIYKTYASVMQSIGQFKEKIQTKSGFDMRQSRLLIAGEELHEYDSAILYDAGVSVRTSIFVKTGSEYEVFHVLGSSFVTKVILPIKPLTSDIEKALKNRRDIPEGSVNCMLTFMYWFFVHRLIKTNKITHRKRIKKRLPKAKEMLFIFKSGRNLQDVYQRGSLRAEALSPAFFPGGMGSEKVYPKLQHHIKFQANPSFEPSQFLDVAGDIVIQGQNLNSSVVPFPDIHHIPTTIDPPHRARTQTFLKGPDRFNHNRKQFIYIGSDDEVGRETPAQP
ncbi:uncharacterized protein LOC133175865 [Saccostrea echinata]|uniref:uncharacterized protein LOC133175865 n=1 Tax=Saccostrea echinata TaxID=191078 RepID=UPI002A838A57|nr:uncharacterized protein LOC133175865 [Saccostrea echinata]